MKVRENTIDGSKNSYNLLKSSIKHKSLTLTSKLLLLTQFTHLIPMFIPLDNLLRDQTFIYQIFMNPMLAQYGNPATMIKAAERRLVKTP